MFLPYVYILRHKINGKFYIGMRSANKLVAEEDLGTHYFSSSKFIKNNFEEYDKEIIAYFIDQISAFEFENNLIKEHWGNPLLINKHYQKSMSKFSMTGYKRADVSEFNKNTKSKPKEIRKYTCVNCEKIFDRLEFLHKPLKDKFTCSQRCNGLNNLKNKKKLPKIERIYSCIICEKNVLRLDKINSPIRNNFVCGRTCNSARNGLSTKGKSNIKNKGKQAWNKGIPNPQAAINGKRGAAKQSNTIKGRKRKPLENGKWGWYYPTTSVTEQVGTISES